MTGSARAAIGILVGTLGVGGCGDSAPESACATDIMVGTPFDLAPNAPLTQIHVDAATGHGGVWLTYNVVDTQRGFDPVIAQINCDGTERIAAMQLEDPANEIDPAIAVSGDAIGLVWQGDTSTAVNNLELRFASFETDLTPLAAPATFQTSRNGQAVVGNSLEVDLVGFDDGFVLAGLRSFPESVAFQGFVQLISSTGVPVSDGIDVGFEADVGHRFVGVADAGDGSVHTWWTRQPAEGDRLAAARIDLSSGSITTEDALTGAEGTTADVSVGNSVFSVYAASRAMPDIVLSADDGSITVELGMAGAQDFSPRIAAAGNRGIIAFYRNISGFSNNLFVQSFEFDGTGFTLGPEIQINAESVPPYAPTLIHIDDDVFFVAWSEGSNPDFIARGQFIQPSF